MAEKNERIFDELLSFLGDPMFQIPVRTFLDENCLIFDPALQPEDDHKLLHNRYKKLIDALLDSFCRDMRITVDDAIQGINKMVAIPDLKEVFNALFDQVLAATDFNIFCQLMIKRNIMIQEQVLIMIIAATGGLPQSLLNAEAQAAAGKAQKEAEALGKPIDFDKQEDELLKQVMEKELATVEARSSKKDAEKASQQQHLEKDNLSKTLELSKNEVSLLQQERKKVEESMKNMVLIAAPLLAPIPASSGGSKKSPPLKLQEQVHLPPSLMKTEKPISGAQAASQWLASAQTDAKQSSTHTAFAASLAKLSPDELKKRQDFLREQRDKLLAMKKETREKQLGEETGKRPQRPQSARTARAAMAGNNVDGRSAEDDKKMAMRRAIAAKLKEEVIGDKY